jgi:hypothetical protein
MTTRKNIVKAQDMGFRSKGMAAGCMLKIAAESDMG